jgi:glycosyltransferase involved in cell wall biosynthesis
MNRRPYRVLFHPFLFFPEKWNGIDEHLLLLCKYMDRARFEPAVLVHETDGEQTTVLAERAGIRAIPAPYAPRASARQRLRALRSLYRAERIDLVHFHTPVTGGQTVPALAARLAGVRATVATYHQMQPQRSGAKARALGLLTHELLIDRTVAVSGGVRESLAAMAGLRRRRIRVIHNGIEPEMPATGASALPAPARGEVRIGAFARLSPEKGFPDLLHGLARLTPERPDVRTFIAGDGPDKDELETLAQRLGIAERVQFLGFRQDARRIMAEVDIVAHTPVYEGFGIVVLEAMAAARPVVTNDAPGGHTELVAHGETGLIVPHGSPEALARALTRLADDACERRRLGQNGQRRCAERFSAEGMAKRTVEVYRRALRRYDRPALMKSRR